MNVVFREFDQNGNGAISWTEFQIALEDQRMHAFLSSLDLDISDAIGLFSVLDSDGTGAIEHSEFLLGCLRLRGGAKAVDMVRVQMEQEWMHQADGRPSTFKHVQLESGMSTLVWVKVKEPSKDCLKVTTCCLQQRGFHLVYISSTESNV